MKIDFTKVTFRPTIGGEPETKDQSKELAEGMYQGAKDLATHICAVKIFNAAGEEEYSEDEVKIIRGFIDKINAPYWMKEGFYNLLQ